MSSVTQIKCDVSSTATAWSVIGISRDTLQRTASFPEITTALCEPDVYSSIYGNSNTQTNAQQRAGNSPKCDSVNAGYTARHYSNLRQKTQFASSEIKPPCLKEVTIRH